MTFRAITRPATIHAANITRAGIDPSAKASRGQAPRLLRAAGIAGVAAAVSLALQPAARAEDKLGGSPDYASWTQYLGGADSSQYSSLDQINKDNVDQLKVAWRYPTGAGASPLFDPIVIDGVMYLLARNNTIVALDAATGHELWTHMVEGGAAPRGMNYWQSADGKDRRLVFLNAGYLAEIDAETGKTIATFGDSGRVDLRIGLVKDIDSIRPLRNADNPGRIFENLAIISLPASGASYDSKPADIHAYDVRTGKLIWIFHTVPRPGEFGSNTWPKDGRPGFGGVHNWSESTVDVKNGIVFIPTGTARYDFYGGNRHGDNLFGNSLIAIDARTGKRLWHFQFVHHDLWDYDTAQAPKLLTVNHDGRRVDVVAQATKQGFLYVFERTTGKPLWPIVERPVPQTDVPGEQTSPTQPFPTKPKAFARQSFTADDIDPYIPAEDQAKLRELFKTSRNDGIFTPPSLNGTIEMPGHNGGADWGGSAVDPIHGMMYVVSKELPVYNKLRLPTARPARRGAGASGNGPGRSGAGASSNARSRAGASSSAAGAARPAPKIPNAGPDFVPYVAPVDFMLQSNGLSAIKPPWSQITAYDLNTGEIKWQVPDGQVTYLAKEGHTDTGSHAPRGGPVATAGELLFVGTSSDRMFRAYDRDTGKVLWS
ncbi:MAG TPA: PQQ-binding-like beta-propeller repeat protein, partial [Gammaproteobacteria bacterium]|nr:PQQ-binding-like beta-propeller repeat protein [Gammaproteobacteria bacterium]